MKKVNATLSDEVDRFIIEYKKKHGLDYKEQAINSALLELIKIKRENEGDRC